MKRLLLLAVVLLVGCLPYEAPDEPTFYSITYEVTGNVSAVSVTYENNQGGTEQGDYKTPFKQAQNMRPGDFAYISAQNQDASNCIICRILVDGEEWKRSQSCGAYVICSCDGLVGDE